jgi:hypothetical protein
MIDDVSAYSVPKEHIEPGDYPDLTYSTPEAAIEEANDQLSEMTYGDIETIDDECDSYRWELILDHYMGNIIYWELTTEEAGVYIDGYTGEIVHYYNYYDWEDGSLDESEILLLAASIADQFMSLPQDRSSPSAELEETYRFEYWINSTDSFGSVSESCWIVQYDRIKDSITSEDNIELYIDKSGRLYSYTKIWNMDLEEFSTTYSVTESQAIETALDDAGSGSSSHSCVKKIVRPNRFYDEGEDDIQYGLDPNIVWEIWVEDTDLNLCLYHVHGTQNTIVGGDFSHLYYQT